MDIGNKRKCGGEYREWGRFFDIVLASSILLLISPFFILIAILIKLTSRGPVFYYQERLGLRGKPFKIIKFRTMVHNAEDILDELLENSPEARKEYKKYFKLKDDPRITPIGRFLRTTSLDELPQLFNVLLGNMSIVGPRPITRDEVISYGECIDELFSVKPGLTGLWQVSGRNEVPYETRVDLDLKYIRFKSFPLDMYILFKTFKVIITGHGAY